jgi:hypothetical protein
MLLAAPKGGVVRAAESCNMLTKRWDRAMRSWLLALIVVAAFTGGAFAQEDTRTPPCAGWPS